MPEIEVKINVGGEMVEIHDIKKIVELSTKKDQEAIDKLKEDLVYIDKEKVQTKKFSDLLNQFKNVSESLVTSGLNGSSVFSKKFATPVDGNLQNSLRYLNVGLQNNFLGINSYHSNFAIEIKSLAKGSQWQSKNLPRAKSVVQAATGTNAQMFKAGTFQVLIKNQAKIFQQNFVNKGVSIVENGVVGKFNPGNFQINGIDITLEIGDSLYNILDKINLVTETSGVKAEIIGTPNAYSLVLKNDKICDEEILLDDFEGLLVNLTNSSGDYLNDYKEYKNITLAEGDTLEIVEYKINSYSASTNLVAEIFSPNNKQKQLILKAQIPGLINNFEIKDNDTILDGSNSGTVFNGLFQSSGSYNHLLENSSDSVIKFDGRERIQSQNKFSLNSMTFDLKEVTDHPIKFEIKSDFTSILATTQSLIDNYNNLRKIYDTPTKLVANTSRDNIFKKDSNLEKFFQEIDNRLYFFRENSSLPLTPEEDIGLKVIKTTLEIEEDGKKVQRSFDNLLSLDTEVFATTFLNNPERIQKFFDLSFVSSSNKYMQPLFQENLGINHKPLGSNILGINLSIDPELIQVYSYQSKVISNLKAGTFWLNGVAITTNHNMTATELAAAINKVSSDSRISAIVKDNAISLVKYNGGFPALDDDIKLSGLHLYDPEKLLEPFFSTNLTITGLGASLSDSSTNLVSGGQISLNNVLITLSGDTITSLMTDINSKKSMTGIAVEAKMDNSGNYYLVFKNSSLQKMQIQNLGGLTGVTIESDTGDSFFFNTGEAVQGSITLNAEKEDKLFAYRITGNSREGSGMITIINHKNFGNKIDNLEIIYLGGGNKEAVEIHVSQGLASFIHDQLVQMQPNNFDSNNIINKLNGELDHQTKTFQETINHKSQLLKAKQKNLTEKLAKAVSKSDQHQAIEEMIKTLGSDNK